MRSLRANRVIGIVAITTMAFTSSIAAAQTVDQQPPAPATAPAETVQPPTAPQAATNPPPQPIPVPPIEGPGGGLHFDSTILLGIGAVVLGAGAYFLLHKKNHHNGNGGTTTTP